MSLQNYRTMNIDAYDPDSSLNFPLSSLTPGVSPPDAASAAAAVSHVRQLQRSGDGEGALAAALASPPYGADDATRDAHAAAVVDALQSIRQADMAPLLGRLAAREGGSELLDTLVKYLYKGMSASAVAAGASPGASRAPGGSGPGFSQVGGRNAGSGVESGAQAMSVLLSWHEKTVEVAGVGAVARVMSDRRVV